MPLEQIFSPEPSFSQRQYQKLSDNAGKWDEQIYGLLASIIPKRLGLRTQIHWQKVDDGQGYAVGSAVLGSNEGSESIGVTIIVKQWHLAPLDTILVGDMAYPMNQDTLKEIFSGGGVASELVSKQQGGQTFDGGGMESASPPAGGGRYVYSSDRSVLANVLATAWEEDIQSFREKIAESPEIVAASANHGTWNIYQKIAASKGKEPKKKKNTKMGVIQVSKNSSNQYSILGNPEGVYDPVMHGVDRPTMKKVVEGVVGPGEAEKEFVSRIDKNRQVMLVSPKEETGDKTKEPVGRKLGEHGEIFLCEHGKHKDSVKECDSFGVWGVKDPAGVTSYGVVFPNVVDFDGKKKDLKIFAGKSCSSTQSKIVGSKEPDREQPFPKTKMETGKVGTLCYLEGKRALATVPFRIISSYMYGDNKTARVKDFYGKELHLSFSCSAKGITKIKKSKALGSAMSSKDSASYVVPSEMKFVELAQSKKMAESAEDHNKYASGSLSANPLRVMRSNDRYVFSGLDLSKYASVNGVDLDFQALTRGQADFVLASFGCPMNKVAKALNVSPGTSVDIHGLTYPKLASETIQVDSRADFIRSLRVDLTKEASVMDDAEIVDSALSLGFINPDNVGKFAEAIPNLKQCASLLSKMLIGSRLGMKNIPEEATSSAIHNIMRVIDGLRRLGLMQKS